MCFNIIIYLQKTRAMNRVALPTIMGLSILQFISTISFSKGVPNIFGHATFEPRNTFWLGIDFKSKKFF